MFDLCTSFLSVLQWTFSAFWRAENVISAHSSTGLINSMNLNLLMLGLEISEKDHLFLNVNSFC